MSSQEIHEQIRREKEARVLAGAGACAETQRLETEGAPPRDEPPMGEEAAFPAAYFAPARGLTKREYFAAAALTGILATGDAGSSRTAAILAVECADMILEELKL